MKSPLYAAIAATGIAAVITLFVISATGIETAHGIAVPQGVTGSNSTVRPVEGEVIMHLDNAEREVMQGNSTGAILELIAAVRLEHETVGIGPQANVPQ